MMIGHCLVRRLTQLLGQVLLLTTLAIATAGATEVDALLERWDALSSSEQQAWRSRLLGIYRQLPPGQQKQLHQRVQERWRALSSSDRQRLRGEIHKRLSVLPTSEQRFLAALIALLHD